MRTDTARTSRRGMDVPRVAERVRRLMPRQEEVLIRDAIRRFGTATADRRPMPDFLIVGTKKGGTTSLMNWLVRHPNVLRMYPTAQKLKKRALFRHQLLPRRAMVSLALSHRRSTTTARARGRWACRRGRGQPLLHVPPSSAAARPRGVAAGPDRDAAARTCRPLLLKLP